MKTKIFAHRGFSGKYPENTMVAFQKAVELGCDGIELDVQLSKDGIPVIIHDENLRRTAGRPGFIKDFTYRELKRFDVSCGADADQGINQILSLKEYFAYIRDYDVITNIELKNGLFRYEGMEKKVVSLVKNFKIEEKVIFSSFNHQSMALCKKILPAVKCGLLTSSWMVGAGAYVKQCGVEYLNPLFTFMTEENMRELRQNQAGAYVWTVDDPAEMARLANLGADGVISNRPDLFPSLQKTEGKD